MINQILEMSEGPTVDGEMAHPVMKDAVLSESGFLRVLLERSTRAPDLRLVFDGVKHMVDENPEWNKVGLCNVILVRLVRVSGWFMDSGRVMVWILPWVELLPRLLALRSLFRGAIGCTPSRRFDLHVFLRSDENVHLSDIVLHQMLAKRVGDL